MIEKVKDIANDLLVIPEQRRHFKTVLEQNHSVSEFIYEIKTRQGKRKQASLTARLVKTDDGLVFYEGFLSDVTEQHETRSRLERLLRDVQGMAYRCEPRPPWRMLWLSEGCGELTGYSTEDLLSQRPDYETLIDKDYRNEVATAVANAIKTKTTYTLYYPIRTASNEKKWVFEKGKAVWDDDGKLMYLDGFVTSASHVSNDTSRDLQEIERREKFQKIRFRLVLLWTFIIQFIIINLTVLLILVLKAAGSVTSIGEAELIGFFGQTVAQVAGLVYLIAKYLFTVNDESVARKPSLLRDQMASAPAQTPPVREGGEEADRPSPLESGSADEEASRIKGTKAKLPKKG
jgi:PAS domain-containing protein